MHFHCSASFPETLIPNISFHLKHVRGSPCLNYVLNINLLRVRPLNLRYIISNRIDCEFYPVNTVIENPIPGMIKVAVIDNTNA